MTPQTGEGGRASRGSVLPILALIGLALLLRLPTFGLGYYIDDYLHLLGLRGELPMHPLGLYDFGRIIEWTDIEGSIGSVPWWTSPECSVRFFRPLASFTLWLDHVLFGENAVAGHAVSFAWFAALLGMVAALYRSLGLSRNAGLLALLLLACSNASVVPAGWIANRNTVIAALFTVTAVWAATRAVAWGRGRALALALACGVLACLAKESGIAAFVLVATWFVLDPKRVEREAGRSPWLPTLLCAGAAVSFLVFLVAGGYGTNSAFYATPWHDPARYASNLAYLFVIGPVTLISPLSLDLVLMEPSLGAPLTVVALCLVVPLATWVVVSLRGEPLLPFLGVWIVVTILPQGGAAISDRLLLGPSIGVAAVLGLLLARALPRRGGSRLVLRRVGAVALVFLAVVIEGLSTLMMGFILAGMSVDIRSRIVEMDVGPPALGHRDVIILQSYSALVPFSAATTYAVEGTDRDLRIWTVQSGRRGFTWTRDDDRTMTIHSLDRPFLESPFEFVYLSDRTVPAVGTRWDGGLFQVEAVASDADGLRAVRLVFERSLDDPRLRFLVTRDDRMVAVEPPAVGTTVEVEAAVAPPFTP